MTGAIDTCHPYRWIWVIITVTICPQARGRDYSASRTISMLITSDIFEAYLASPCKCWFRFQGEETLGNTYSIWVEKQNHLYRKKALNRILDDIADNDFTSSPAQPLNIKMANWRLATDFVARKYNLEAYIPAIERLSSEGKPVQLIPMRFTFNNKLTKKDKLTLAFDSLVLSEAFRCEIVQGKIFYDDGFSRSKVKIHPLILEVRKLNGKIVHLLSKNSPPEIVLNRHCQECDYQAKCRQTAIEKDDLSLLAGMNEKERTKYNSKGIFTVRQLSYTFRPRRRPKRLRDKREKYHHSRKALAIRGKKIHIVGNPELKIKGAPIYLDVYNRKK
jgi:predicted RecB family nuclease